jgi:hypothetical protein
MHYPVMTERRVAARWKVSLKTMRRWRQDKVGPAWHKLFHHVLMRQYCTLRYQPIWIAAARHSEPVSGWFLRSGAPSSLLAAV